MSINRTTLDRIVAEQDVAAAEQLIGCDHGAQVNVDQAEQLAGDYICAAADGSILAWGAELQGSGRELVVIERAA